MGDHDRVDSEVLSRYQVGQKLGAGAYGIVWQARPRDQPKKVVALKKAFDAFQHSTDAQRTYREVSILKKTDHPNIVKLLEVIGSQSGKDLYLVFECMNTDLHRLIYEHKLQPVHKKYVMYQTLLGLHYLHSAKLVHRDLKPSNLLLSSKCDLKICDFGLVRHLGSQRGEEPVLTEGVATRWYRAPEVLMGSQSYDTKADLWSMGCIMAEMHLQHPLFNCQSIPAQTERILQVVGRPTPQEISYLHSQVADTLLKQIGPVRQKSVKEIFGTEIDSEYVNLVYQLLTFHAEKRPSAEEALRHPYFSEFFKEEDLQICQRPIKMELNDSRRLSPEAYRQAILKYFVERREPQRFSDLRRGQRSFGKLVSEARDRRASGEKSPQPHKQGGVFRELLKERGDSVKQRPKSSGSNKGRVNSQNGVKRGVTDKQNMVMNGPRPELQRFGKGERTGTFACLRKVGAPRFAK